MTTDIKLGDNELVLQAPNVDIVQEGNPKTSVAINFRNPSGFWHLSGPRSFEPGNSFSFFWNDNSKWHGPNLTLTTGGNVGVGTSDPKSTFHVHGEGVHSSGPGAGFSFVNRDLPDGQTPGLADGERFVWYASGTSARLWSDNDLLAVERMGALAKMTVNGTVDCLFLKVGGKLILNELASMKQMIDGLKAEVAALKKK